MKKIYNSRLWFISIVFGVLFLINFQAKAVCHAAFSYSINNTTRTVTFSNTSTGGGLLSYWRFGDNTTSNTYSPTKVYANYGTYNVCLYVHDSGYLCIDSFCTTITITNSCNATFSNIADTSNYKKINFTSGNTGANLSFSWNFGDSGTSTLRNPSHTYVNAGTYNVCCIVSKSYNGDTCISYSCHSVVVSAPVACHAAFSHSINQTTRTVTFTNTSTGTGLFYYWKFGDNTTSSLANPPAKTYANYGTYNVCLIVYNSSSCVDSFCRSIVINNPCNAAFGYYADTTVAKKVNFYSTNTLSNLSYLWTWGDSSPVSTIRNPNHIYVNAGTYTVCLRVSRAYNGDTCTTTECKVITVSNFPTTPCQAYFSYTPNAADRKYIQFTNYSTGSNLIYTWSFGDTTQVSHSQNLYHLYAQYGTYTVCLNVVNSLDTSCHSTFCKTIVVADSNICDGTFSWGYAGDTLSKHKYAFWPNMLNVSNVSFLWTFGDSTTSTQYSPVHLFNTGTFTVCLKVKKTNGLDTCVNQKCTTITTVGCHANFVSTMSQSNPRTFNFTGTGSTGASLKYYWTYGDGSGYNSGNNSSVNHGYSAQGSYTVCLTVKSALDTTCTDTKCKTIVVNDSMACGSYFTYTMDSSYHRFSFTPYLPNLPNTTYFWHFSDSTTATGYSVSHVFPNGNWYACLKTTRIYGLDTCIREYCQNINVGCKANFTSSPDGANSLKINFSNTSTGANLTYNWSFGSGLGSTLKNPIKTYDSAGTYTVCLTVHSTTDSTCYNIKCMQIVVNKPVPCAAKFYFVRDTLNNQKVFFANLSEGDSLSYYWNFGDGTPYSNQRNPDHTYANAGHYRVCLYISGVRCTANYCDSVFVGPGSSSCFSHFAFTVNPVNKTASFINQSIGNHLASLWSFGDSSISTAFSPTHTYFLPGVYSVCLLIADSQNHNCSGISCQPLVIPGATPVNCTANFLNLQDTGYHPGHKVSFYATSAFPSGITTFYWTFGDGDTSTIKNPIHIYGNGGVYSVCLNVSNPIDTCFISHCEPIRIDSSTGIFEGDDALQQVSFYPNPFDENLNIEFNASQACKIGIDVYDITGRTYFSSELAMNRNHNHFSIETSQLPKGVYFIKLNSNGQYHYKKLVK